MNNPEIVIENLIRISKRAIISLPNFGFWKIRRDLLFKGLMPKNKILPYEWYNTPNIHLCTLRDFEEFCVNKRIKIIERIYTNENGNIYNSRFSENLWAFQGIFCISKSV